VEKTLTELRSDHNESVHHHRSRAKKKKKEKEKGKTRWKRISHPEKRTGEKKSISLIWDFPDGKDQEHLWPAILG